MGCVNSHERILVHETRSLPPDLIKVRDRTESQALRNIPKVGLQLYPDWLSLPLTDSDKLRLTIEDSLKSVSSNQEKLLLETSSSQNSDSIFKSLSEAEDRINLLRVNYDIIVSLLVSSISDLKTSLTQQEDLVKASKLKGILQYMNRNVKESLQDAVDRWKIAVIPEESSYSTSMNSTMLDSDFKADDVNFALASEYDDIKSNEEVNEILSEMNKYVLENNPLLHELRSYSIDESTKHMPIANLFKMFEEMMDRKYEVDCQDIKAKRKPRYMTEFLMEHLTRMFGLKKLAEKELGRLIPALRKLNEQKHPTAMLFCRLLQIFHPEPVPFHIAIFLTRTRWEFQKLVEKAAKGTSLKNQKRGLKIGPQAKGNSKDYLGGNALLANIFSLVYSLFENDKLSRAITISLLKPESVTMNDYLVFKICHKMAKMGKTAEQVFTDWDKDGGGSIDKEELLEGMKGYLDLYMTNHDIETLYNSLDPNNEGEIKSSVFYSVISIDKYAEMCKSEVYSCSKTKFCLILLEVYEKLQKRELDSLTKIFKTCGKELLDLGSFLNLMQKITTEINVMNASSMYQEAQLHSGHAYSGINCAGFCKFVLDKAIGGRGIRDFRKIYCRSERFELCY